jgi:rod shape determining protein RodA
MLSLCAIGTAMVYSTTTDPTHGVSRLFLTQLYAITIGLVAMAVMLLVDYRTFTDKSHLIYLGLIALLLYVMFFGMVQMGARRWIPLRVVNLQPSEFAKMGWRSSSPSSSARIAADPTWVDLAIGGALTLLPLALIAKEPDLGTAVTLVPVFLAIAYLAGMRMRILGMLLLGLLLVSPIAWKFAPQGLSKITDLDLPRSLAGCERRRVPADPGAHHGRIGGLTGKGFRHGTQGQLAVPARRP